MSTVRQEMCLAFAQALRDGKSSEDVAKAALPGFANARAEQGENYDVLLALSAALIREGNLLNGEVRKHADGLIAALDDATGGVLFAAVTERELGARAESAVARRGERAFVARLVRERAEAERRSANPDGGLHAARLDAPRDRPTPERLDRSYRTRVATEGAINHGEELPLAVARLARANRLTEREASALGRYRSDFLFGSERAPMTSRYAERVDGGGQAGDTSVRKLEAFARYRAARDRLSVAGLARLVDAVMLNEVALEEASTLYAGAKDRRVAAAMALKIAARILCGDDCGRGLTTAGPQV